MGKHALFAMLLCVTVSCGGGSSPEADVPGTAAVAGYVYEGSPVVVVGIAADAPVGDVPVANAEVRAVNLHGTTLSTVLTGADGSFRIGGLPPGYLRLEVRKDATSPSPDVTAEVTGIGDDEIAVNAIYPIDRDAAIAAALAVVPPDTRVVCSLQPFPASTRIAPSGGDPGSPDPVPTVSRTLPADEWFLLVDLFPGASYGHPLEFVFVDATTGGVVRETNVQWPPLANGNDFWGAEWSLVGALGVDILSVDPSTLPPDQPIVTSPEVVREPPTMLAAPLLPGPPDPDDVLSALALHNTDPASIFAILWRAGAEDYRVRSSLDMYDLLANAGVPSANIQTISTVNDGRKAMQDTNYTTSLQYVNGLMQQRLDQGLHSTLIVWINSHGGGSWFGRYHGTGSGQFQSTQAADLQLTTTPACKVRVILDFCFAREFGEILAALFDAMQPADRPDYVIYCACGKTEFCYSIPYGLSWATLGFLDIGSRFTDELTEVATIANGDITGCLNPTGTDIVGSLSSLLGTLDFISNNAVQHPSAIVQRGWPTRCIAAGTLGVVLDQDLTEYLVAGTFIPLSDIQGATVAEPDACATQHLHSETGITILGVLGGPFPDPDPSVCGYGSVVTR